MRGGISISISISIFVFERLVVHSIATALPFISPLPKNKKNVYENIHTSFTKQTKIITILHDTQSTYVKKYNIITTNIIFGNKNKNKTKKNIAQTRKHKTKQNKQNKQNKTKQNKQIKQFYHIPLLQHNLSLPNTPKIQFQFLLH